MARKKLGAKPKPQKKSSQLSQASQASQNQTPLCEVLVRRTGQTLDTHKYDPPQAKAEAQGLKLKIPPNYPVVDICKPGGKVVYVAKDQNGRTQIGYSREYSEDRENIAKPEHFRKLTPEVWEQLNATVDAAVAQKEWTVRKLAAVAVLLIQSCFFRPGTKSAKGADAHYGTVTLLAKHLKVATNEGCSFEFVGKSGKKNRCAIGASERLSSLSRLLAELKKSKKDDEPLFRINRHTLQVQELRSFLDSATTQKIRPKDIRTYHANLTFLQELRKEKMAGTSQKERNARIKKAVVETALRLNNTPAIARKSYILRPVLDAAKAGTIDSKAPLAETLHALLLPKKVDAISR